MCCHATETHLCEMVSLIGCFFLAHRERQEQLMGYRKRGPKPKHLLLQVRKEYHLILLLIIYHVNDTLQLCLRFLFMHDSLTNKPIYKKYYKSVHFLK